MDLGLCMTSPRKQDRLLAMAITYGYDWNPRRTFFPGLINPKPQSGGGTRHHSAGRAWALETRQESAAYNRFSRRNGTEN